MLRSEKVYLELDEIAELEVLEEVMIMFYRLVIPKKDVLAFKLGKLLQLFNDEVEDISIDSENIILECNMGYGAHLSNLQHMHNLQKTIQEEVKCKMDKSYILDYSLIIRLSEI